MFRIRLALLGSKTLPKLKRIRYYKIIGIISTRKVHYLSLNLFYWRLLWFCRKKGRPNMNATSALQEMVNALKGHCSLDYSSKVSIKLRCNFSSSARFHLKENGSLALCSFFSFNLRTHSDSVASSGPQNIMSHNNTGIVKLLQGPKRGWVTNIRMVGSRD